ncbi:MAG: aminotransferase class V-fold PLP-dependent enzyme [Prochloron sp. SP5CPC1]|nr:aminotransferase class V-fold PLP-dependent enzyme [Candidatus Paraprochloron terpiosi SP5CPC1]
MEQNIEKVNSDLIDNGQKVLACLESAYNHPEKYQVLSSSHGLMNRLNNPQYLPQEGCEMGVIIEEAIATIFSGYCNVSHPQYYGYISPKPLPISLIGDLLASGLNQTPGAWRAGPAATVIEAETLQWISQFIGYENSIGKVPNGIFTSGGSMANASALKLARDKILGRDLQDRGLAVSKFQPTVYMSAEGHFSIWKALDFLGLGRNCLRRIAVDENGRINLNALQEQIKQDIQVGAKPICLVGTGGTSATGSVDNLDALGSVARDYDMWFHVDAAAGGVFANLPETREYFQGINLADSVTIDPCKWLFVPFGIGCLLTKDGSELVKSFQASSHYWEELSEPDLFQMGLPGTRQWRSLGLWMAFKHLGSNGYRQLLRNTRGTVFHLAEKVQSCEQLELLQQPTLPVCCFRIGNYPKHLSIDEINRLVQRAITETGKYYITLLDWRGSSYFRVSINNFRTNTQHIDSLIDAILHQIKLLNKK